MCLSPLCVAVALRPAQRCWGGRRCPEKWGPPSLWCTASDRCIPWDPGAHSSDENNKTFRAMKANHAGAQFRWEQYNIQSDESKLRWCTVQMRTIKHPLTQTDESKPCWCTEFRWNSKTFRLIEANHAKQSLYVSVCMHVVTGWKKIEDIIIKSVQLQGLNPLIFLYLQYPYRLHTAVFENSANSITSKVWCYQGWTLAQGEGGCACRGLSRKSLIS